MRPPKFFPAFVFAAVACAVPLPQPAPPPVVVTAPAEPVESPYAGMETRIAALVNKERKQHGLKPLAINPRLDQAARIHARNMAAFRKMSHFLPESRFPTLSHRAQYVSYPYSMIAENIALGYTDAESVVRGWMESPGHRRNILNREVSEIGTGVVSSTTGGLYFCQVFGRQLSSI